MGNITKKFGQYFYLVIVVAYLLPFFGVSCDGLTVVKVNGFDLVGGCNINGPGMDMEMDDGGDSGKSGKIEVDPQPWAIAALALALIGFGIGFRKKREVMLANIVISAAGLVSLILLFIKARGEAPENAGAGPGGGGPDLNVEIVTEFGFWLACFGFVAVIAGSVAALKQWDQLRATAEADSDAAPGSGASPPG